MRLVRILLMNLLLPGEPSAQPQLNLPSDDVSQTEVPIKGAVMTKLVNKLSKQLKAKGLRDKEMSLYIHDILWILKLSPAINLEMMNNRMHMLGWRATVDGALVDLISACHDSDFVNCAGMDTVSCS